MRVFSSTYSVATLAGRSRLCESWHDDAGKLVARAGVAGDDYWFELVGGGLCRFRRESDEFHLYPSSTASNSVARDSFYRGMLPFLLTLRNVEALHASAIVINETVYAFCAPSGTGKSTLAFACARRGHAAWADDALLLSFRGHVPHALSLPFCLREAKRQPSWASGTGTQENVPGLPVIEKLDPLGGLSLPLGGVFVVERRAENGSVQPALELLTPVESLPLLLANAYTFTTLAPERRRDLASHYLDLAAAVPVYKLRLPDNLSLLDSAIRLLERAIDEASE